MGTTVLDDAKRHLERAATAADRDRQLYHIREAHQLVVAADELGVRDPRLVQ